MEHAKKMVLVPAEEVGRWKEPMIGGGITVNEETHMPTAGRKSVQTPGDAVSRLDAELTDILHSNKYCDDAEKWKQYLQVLQRYLFLVEARNGPLDPTLPGASTLSQPTGQRENEDFNESLIIKSIPKIYRNRAIALVEYLRNSPTASQRITWDQEGRVTIDGMFIPNSNIIDLVNDAMRSRKGFQANGRRQFIKSLRAGTIPREFIGNKLLWSMGEQSIGSKRKRISADLHDNNDDDDEEHDHEDNTTQNNKEIILTGTKPSTRESKKKQKKKDRAATDAILEQPEKRQKTTRKNIELPRGFEHWLSL